MGATLYSPSERRFKIWMAAWGVIYLAAGLVFFLFPQSVLDFFNRIAQAIPWLKPHPNPPEHMWGALAFGYMALISLASFQAAKNVKRTFNRSCALFVVAGKLASTLAFLFLLIFEEHRAGYAVGACTDIPLGLITLWFYAKSVGWFDTSVPIQVPKDEAFHPEGRTAFELWAMEGELLLDKGEKVWFTNRFAGSRGKSARGIPGIADQLVICTPGETQGAKHRAALNFGLTPSFCPFFSGVDESELDVYLRHWMRPGQGFPVSSLKYVESLSSYRLRNFVGDGSLDLTIPLSAASRGDPLLLGEKGSLEMGDGRIKGYVYFTQGCRGSITYGGKAARIKGGTLYLEHLWGRMDLQESYRLWYWFIIQLEGGMRLIIYWIQDKKENNNAYVHIFDKGKWELLRFVSLKGARVGGGLYPTEWDITIPKRDIVLHLSTANPHQYMPSFLWLSNKYWDGCWETVTGRVNGADVKGFATGGLSGEVSEGCTVAEVEVPYPIAAYIEEPNNPELSGKIPLLDKVIRESKLLQDLDEKQRTSGKEKKDFLIAIKPNCMMLTHYEDPPVTYTDPQLVEHLVDVLYDEGYRNIKVVEARNCYGVFYDNRSVENVLKAAGYNLDSGKYGFVDLTLDAEKYNYGGGGLSLGDHKAGKTWRDAGYRISFAKNKTHILTRYTLTLKNIYGTLPEENKPWEYHMQREWDCCTLSNFKKFPVHFGLIDAYFSSDGLVGLVGTDNPKKTTVILGGCNLAAVDKVGSKLMGYSPTESSIYRLYVNAFGLPKYELKSNIAPGYVYPEWDRSAEPHERFYLVRKIFEWAQVRYGKAIPYFMDLCEESFLGFMLLFLSGQVYGCTMDPEKFPMKKLPALFVQIPLLMAKNAFRFLAQVVTGGPDFEDMLKSLKVGIDEVKSIHR